MQLDCVGYIFFSIFKTVQDCEIWDRETNSAKAAILTGSFKLEIDKKL